MLQKKKNRRRAHVAYGCPTLRRKEHLPKHRFLDIQSPPKGGKVVTQLGSTASINMGSEGLPRKSKGLLRVTRDPASNIKADEAAVSKKTAKPRRVNMAPLKANMFETRKDYSTDRPAELSDPEGPIGS